MFTLIKHKLKKFTINYRSTKTFAKGDLEAKAPVGEA